LRDAADLDGWTRSFAAILNELLHGTVAESARVVAVLSENRRVGWVGNKISERAPFPGEDIPLKIGRRKAAGYLRFWNALALDDEGEYLTVSAGTFGVYAGGDDRECLVRYEYNREPKNGYPAAHLHVHGESAAIEQFPGLAGRGKSLADLHFPVGGRRFRPCLEDLIEFVVTEGIATGREGWEAVVEKHREDFQASQLRAAVRRNPEHAIEILRRLGKI
jgi:hypothetical protein